MQSSSESKFPYIQILIVQWTWCHELVRNVNTGVCLCITHNLVQQTSTANILRWQQSSNSKCMSACLTKSEWKIIWFDCGCATDTIGRGWPTKHTTIYPSQQIVSNYLPSKMSSLCSAGWCDASALKRVEFIRGTRHQTYSIWWFSFCFGFWSMRPVLTSIQFLLCMSWVALRLSRNTNNLIAFEIWYATNEITNADQLNMNIWREPGTNGWD